MRAKEGACDVAAGILLYTRMSGGSVGCKGVVRWAG